MSKNKSNKPSKAVKAKPSAKKGANNSTTAIHLKEGNDHMVGIGNLKVVIVPDGDHWFAQGLEIDYAAQGSSVADVKKQFENGIVTTLNEHLKVYGTIEKFLKAAPAEVWNDFYGNIAASVSNYTHVSFHEVEVKKSLPNTPFSGIQYIEQRKAA